MPRWVPERSFSRTKDSKAFRQMVSSPGGGPLWWDRLLEAFLWLLLGAHSPWCQGTPPGLPLSSAALGDPPAIFTSLRDPQVSPTLTGAGHSHPYPGGEPLGIPPSQL